MKQIYRALASSLLILYFLLATTISYGPSTASATPLPADTPLYRWQFGSSGSGDGQLNNPRGITVDSNNNIYVADSGNHRIQKFDSEGNFLAKWGTQGSGDGQLNSPWGITVDSNNNIYVVDSNNHRIQKFDSEGNFLAKWGSIGGGDGQLLAPRGITVDSHGSIYITDAFDRIQKFDSDGTFITKWGTSGSGDGQLRSPQGIAIDSSDNIYVIEDQNFRIQKFDSTGTFLTKWGHIGNGAGGFMNPTDIAIDVQDNIYAVHYSNDIIQKFDKNGTYLASWSPPSYGGSGFSIAVDQAGNIYFAGSSNKISVFSYAVGVKTLPNVEDNAPVLIETPHGTDITCGTSVTEASAAVHDTTHSYPLGLIDFCFDTTSDDNQVVVTFVTDLKPNQVVARKYNSTNNTYFNIENAVITETTHEGQPALRLTYTIIDNGSLDLDPAVGKIKDPVGLAVAESSGASSGELANTGLSVPLMAAAALSSIATGLVVLRRRLT